MIRKLSPTSIQEAQQILAVQLPAYKVEAKQINSTAIPRLYDTVHDIQNCTEVFYGFFADNTLTGLISFTDENSMIDIHRLVVSPHYFKQGIATKLLLYLFDIYPNGTKYMVQTGKANLPAISLYKKHGFIEKEDIHLSDGLILTRFEKTE